MYRYCTLIPAAAPQSAQHNQKLLGAATLGIEVTEPALAARCGLGNIDPQHDASGSPLAAIEAAVTWPLPPRGSTLATIRPDLDAFGAMALLSFRAEGRMLTPPMKSRIAEVGVSDRHSRGPWPGPRPWPKSTEDLLPDLGGGDIGVLTAAMRDRTHAVDDRVRLARAWLETGALPESHARAPRERAEQLWQALSSGLIEIDNTRAPGRLAAIVSNVEGALQLGYRLAPAVVALNPDCPFPGGAIGPKYTIAQWGPGHADLDAFAGDIARMETGWGGSPTIKGSPQGAPSRMDMETVTAALVRRLT